MPDWVIDVSTSAAALAAVIVAFIATRSYKQLTPEAILLRRQNEFFRSLSTEVQLMLTSLMTMQRNVRDEGSIDSFFLPPYSDTARRLLKLLDKSAGLEVTDKVFGTDYLLWDRLLALRGVLIEQSDLSASVTTERAAQEDLGPTLSAHLWLGLMTIARACEARSQAHRKEDSLSTHLQDAIDDVESNASALLSHANEATRGLWKG